MQPLAPQQLAQWLADSSKHGSKQAPLLLDVREAWEYELCHLPQSTLLPMQQIGQRYQELDENQPVVVICHHGVRSMQVALFLEQQGFQQVYNLQGGIANWAQQIEPTMPQY